MPATCRLLISEYGVSFEQDMVETSLQVILQTHFKDWSLGHRMDIMEPLLGDGTFKHGTGCLEKAWRAITNTCK